MMSKSKQSILITLMLAHFAVSCGDNAAKTPASRSSSTEETLLAHFEYESTIDADAKRVIEYDLKSLANWSDASRADAAAKFAAISGLKTISAKTLSQFISDRITYMYPATGENFAMALINSSKKKIIPLAVPGAPKDGIVAANQGAQIYAAYPLNKASGATGLMIQYKKNYVPFLSLHTGVMMLGPSFSKGAASLDDAAKKSNLVVNSIARLNALFHEARHSDGNIAAGTHGMLHVVCPSNGTGPDEYAGLQACDKWSNGANAIGALIIDVLMGMCDDTCTTSDKAAIEAVRIDHLSRVIVDATAANYGDATPEPALAKIDTTGFVISP